MHLDAVLRRIARAAQRVGRDPSDITIVAVTKGHPLDIVREAAAGGLLDIGENRVQEALEKQEAWPDAPVRWHLIGHLQRNKAKLAVGRFTLVHSVDSVRLAEELEKVAAGQGRVQDVLVQVNVAREPQKTGVLPDEAAALAAHVAARSHLRLRGLMAMAPLTDDAAVIRETFRGLRELRDRLRPPSSDLLSVLSMGMSSDFEIAIEEGATMLRLGTVLFGERQP
jgi:pyridoxal phosphate enzyme (YggS family)